MWERFIAHFMVEAPVVIQPKRFLPAVAFLGVAILASALLFWNLGSKPLENWDEGIHANVSLEMARKGAWFDLSYRDALYTAKPPLKFWLTAPLFAMLGETELAVRIWSAVAGVATALLLAFWAWRSSRSVRLALLAGGVFLAGRFVLFHAFRTGETDGLLTLFIVAALYAYWRSWQRPRWLLAFGILTGLAVMTKSFAGLIPVLIAGIDATLARRWREFGMRNLLAALGWFLVIVVPWHAIELVRYGSAFWQGYFTFHVLERATDVLYKNVVPWYWYLEIIFRRTFPLSMIVLFALIFAVRRAFRNRDSLDRMLLVWFLVVLMLFSFVQTKFDWYILPLYPALALIMTRSIAEYLQAADDRAMHVLAFLTLAATIALLPSGLAHTGLIWMMTPYGFLPDAVSTSVAGRLSAGVLVSVIVVVLARSLRGRIVVAPTRAIGIFLTVYFLVVALAWQGSYLRHQPMTAPFKEIAEKVDVLNVEGIDVTGFTLVTQPAGYFYLRRIPDLKLREVKTPDDLTSRVVLTTLDAQNASIRDRGDAILEAGNYILIEQRERPAT